MMLEEVPRTTHLPGPGEEERVEKEKS